MLCARPAISPTFRIASAWESHLALPSFSVIEPRSRNTWVTTILETDDWLELADNNVDEEKVFRSKVVLVGEVKLCCVPKGENAAVRVDPPPPLLPPPPPA